MRRSSRAVKTKTSSGIWGNAVSASVFVAATFASAFTFMSLVRLVRLVRGIGSRPLFLAHAVMACCLWLAVPAVYRWVDALLGGQNIANLLSHIGFALVFYWGASEAALGLGRRDVADRIRKLPGGAIALVCIAALITTFALADLPQSSMGLNEFYDQPTVIAYKSLSFAYPAWAGAQLVGPFALAARERPHPLQRVSFTLMCAGFLLLPAVPVLQALVLLDPALQAVTDGVLFPSIALVLLGASAALFARSAKVREKPAHQAD